MSRIRELRISAPTRACPGNPFFASYSALLDDGTAVPFATRYDKDRPPRLHMVFLERTSLEADPLDDGGWRPDRDPLRSANTGFRLRASLRAKPSLEATTLVEPDYHCTPHVFRFQGAPGPTGQAGGDGPDVTVRLAIVPSRFYERLVVAAIEVGEAPPFYLLADANAIPPRDWLLIGSAGGPGGRGAKGPDGDAGRAGAAGCPGGSGEPGRNGGAGGVGGSGGRGGRISIIAPAEEPFLSGLVDAHSPGGPGGRGGAGGKAGKGGPGGRGNTDRDGRRCADGAAAGDGQGGATGPDGHDGRDGPRPQVLTVPTADVFGTRVPPELDELLRGPRPRR